MPVDPDIAAMLETQAQSTGPQLDEIPIEQLRAMHVEMVAAQFGPVDEVRSTRELQIPGPAGDIAATVYEPHTIACDGVLAFFHGGGFVACSRETHDGVCRALATLAGIEVVSVEYRLAPEHPFPAGVEDCWAATQWLVENAEAAGLSSSRIGVGGDSAGGNLSAVMALRARDAGLPLACQFLLFPMVSALHDTESCRAFAQGYGLTIEDARWCTSTYLQAGKRTDPEVSPLPRDDLSGVAPAVIVTAEYDILRDEAEQYAARLASSGVPTLLWRALGMTHGFLAFRGMSAGVAATYPVAARLLQMAYIPETLPFASAGTTEGERASADRQVA
jgi:acetyl esterase